MFGPQHFTLGLMCPHCNSNVADKSFYGCHEWSCDDNSHFMAFLVSLLDHLVPLLSFVI